MSYLLCMTYTRNADTISSAVIIAFLDSLTTIEGKDRTRRINGHPVGESMCRALFRWRKEGVQPRLEPVERALSGFGLMIREFEEWANDRCQSIWLDGSGPDWWDDESESLWRLDLSSSDPLWRREARDYGIAIGEIKPRKRRRRAPSTITARRTSPTRQPVAA